MIKYMSENRKISKKAMCSACADKYKVAYENNPKVKIDYRFKMYEGKCEICHKSIREGLGMYDIEGITFK